MDELLQKLLEAEVLSDETKTELEAAFKSQLDEAITAAKDDAAADVRAELTEQWIKERDVLVEAIDTKVGEFLETELNELKEDIERFRDVEAEYAEKLVESKASMKDELNNDLKELVEKIDKFLEIRLTAEIDELREDIETVRKDEFGRRIFEAFAEEYIQSYSDEESAEVSLRETTERLREMEEELELSESKRLKLERDIKLKEILSPLSGRQRDVMEAILQNVDTVHLEEGYKTFIGRVIRETEEADSEKEGKVLAESASEVEGDKKKKDKKDKKDKSDEECEDDVKEGLSGTVITGDTEVIEESVNPEAAARLQQLRKLAGITS